MEIVSKVWYRHLNVKKKYYREYKLSLNEKEKQLLVEAIESNKLDIVNIKEYIKRDINLSDKIKTVNCINGCVDKSNNRITLLSDIYATESFFRLLKIEKLLYGE